MSFLWLNGTQWFVILLVASAASGAGLAMLDTWWFEKKDRERRP